MNERFILLLYCHNDGTVGLLFMNWKWRKRPKIILNDKYKNLYVEIENVLFCYCHDYAIDCTEKNRRARRTKTNRERRKNKPNSSNMSKLMMFSISISRSCLFIFIACKFCAQTLSVLKLNLMMRCQI